MILTLLSCNNQSDHDPAGCMRQQLEKARGFALLHGLIFLLQATTACMHMGPPEHLESVYHTYR